MRKVAQRVESRELRAEDITEAEFARHLYTAGIPDPDLVIRTSGEQRLSNFLLWQLAYAEIYVTDVLWPDFDEGDLDTAFREYGLRKRRFGKTEQQVTEGTRAMTRVIVALIGFAIVIPSWSGASLGCEPWRVVVAVCCDEYANGLSRATGIGCFVSDGGAGGHRLDPLAGGNGGRADRLGHLGGLVRFGGGCRFRRAAETLRGVNEVGLWYPVDRFALELVGALDSGSVAVHGVGRGLGERLRCVPRRASFRTAPIGAGDHPKKTREGFFGSVVAAVAVVWLTSSVLPDVPALVAAALGVVLSVRCGW